MSSFVNQPKPESILFLENFLLRNNLICLLAWNAVFMFKSINNHQSSETVTNINRIYCEKNVILYVSGFLDAIQPQPGSNNCWNNDNHLYSDRRSTSFIAERPLNSDVDICSKDLVAFFTGDLENAMKAAMCQRFISF